MKNRNINDLSLYQDASYFTSILSQAVKEAKELNRKCGLPNDFVINDSRFYELPNGKIVAENPLTDKK